MSGKKNGGSKDSSAATAEEEEDDVQVLETIGDGIGESST